MLNNLTILDFETTGLNPESDFVTEIGAVRVVAGHIIGRYQTVVNFGGTIPAHITQLTGITQEELNAGCDPVKAFRILRAFIGDSVIVAHNAAFDLAFLARSYNRYGSEGLRVENSWLCTKRLAQDVLISLDAPDNFGLAGLCRHFGIEQQGHHRALNDAIDCFALLSDLLHNEQTYAAMQGITPERLFNQPSLGRTHTSYYRWIPNAVEGKEASND